MLLDFQAGSAAGIHNPRLGNNRMRKQGERGGAELRLALSFVRYLLGYVDMAKLAACPSV